MFVAACLVNTLLATLVVARPSSRSLLGQRIARRARRSNPLTASTTRVADGSNSTNVDYSDNWSGAVLVANSATFQSVTGTFTVPTPKEPSGESGEHSASAWVGIDGDTCGSAILQTGVDFTVSGDGVSFDAWYEWYPDYAYDFSGISISAGDEIAVSVEATSTTGGTATVSNLSTGQKVTHTFSGQPALCLENAEWIVEDYEENNGLVPLANWGTVTFTGVSAGTVDGATMSPASATLIDLEQNGDVLSSVSASGSSVTIEYTGP